jgi:hypothetical protein
MDSLYSKLSLKQTTLKDLEMNKLLNSLMKINKQSENYPKNKILLKTFLILLHQVFMDIISLKKD